MLARTLLAWVALLPAVFAAPSRPAVREAALDIVSQYFNEVAQQARVHRQLSDKEAVAARLCNVAAATLDHGDLTGPNLDEVVLHHVAIGRGSQNYTCASSTSDDAPVAAGAVAVLYNATCLSSRRVELANLLTQASAHFDFPAMPDIFTDDRAKQPTLVPSELFVSGHHYFSANPAVAAANNNNNTKRADDDASSSPPPPPKILPFFSLDHPDRDSTASLGRAFVSLNETVAVPEGQVYKGPDGASPVAWLHLKRSANQGDNEDVTGEPTIREVYRVQTVGGAPPKTCQGMADSFVVPYAAQYWFYADKA